MKVMQRGIMKIMPGKMAEAMADPEIQSFMPKWEAVEESHEVEVYMATPMP